MILSDALQFVYIRTPKTASSSMLFELDRHFGEGVVLGTPYLDHRLATQARVTVADVWHKYWTFGFVRNPWTWAVSAFGQDMRTPWYMDFGTKSDDFIVWLEALKLTPLTWLTDANGRVIVDTIFCFEEIKEACRHIARHCGAPFEITKRVNPGVHDYAMLMTDEADEIIQKKFEAEINMFGYRRPQIAQDEMLCK